VREIVSVVPVDAVMLRGNARFLKTDSFALRLCVAFRRAAHERLTASEVTSESVMLRLQTRAVVIKDKLENDALTVPVQRPAVDDPSKYAAGTPPLEKVTFDTVRTAFGVKVPM
jgi:hypothetical protein